MQPAVCTTFRRLCALWRGMCVQGDLFAEEQFVGRAKDKKPTMEKNDEPGSKVHLEYR